MEPPRGMCQWTRDPDLPFWTSKWVIGVTWTRPEVTDVVIECREDVLQGCWSASEPNPIAGKCDFMPAMCPMDV